MKKLTLPVLVTALFANSLIGCSTRSAKPEDKSIKLVREEPSKKCRNMGKIMGRTGTIKGGPEEALVELQREAANKGATHVMVEQYSDNQTTVTGIAYECP